MGLEIGSEIAGKTYKQKRGETDIFYVTRGKHTLKLFSLLKRKTQNRTESTYVGVVYVEADKGGRTHHSHCLREKETKIIDESQQ